MYHGTPSPIFDVPEFPSLRRVKPLPKRRRTTPSPTESFQSLHDSQPSPPFLPHSSAMAPPLASHTIQEQQNNQLPALSPLPRALDVVDSDSGAEGLLAPPDASATVSLHDYYLPLLGDVQNFLAASGGSPANVDPDKAASTIDSTGNSTAPNSAATAAARAAAAALAAVRHNANGHLPLPPVPTMPHLSDMDSVEFGVHFAAAAAAAAAAAGVTIGGLAGFTGTEVGGFGVDDTVRSTDLSSTVARENDTPRSGGRSEDHADHARQSWNTKKRKVPANAGGSPRGGDGDHGRPGSPFLDEDGLAASTAHGVTECDSTQRSRDRDKERAREYDPTSQSSPLYPPPPFPGQLALLVKKKGKLTGATLAGLQHKELLKTRKRQLAAVIGALNHGDTLALDQALSVNYSRLAGSSASSTKIRRSKRHSVRLTREMKILLEKPERKNPHPDAIPFPTREFQFLFPSATSDRLVEIKDEVLELRRRFEAELERQAAKALKLAAGESGKGILNKGRAKRERQERDRERAAKERQKTTVATKGIAAPLPQGDGEATSAMSHSPSIASAGNHNSTGGGKTKGKKKKRSALANASNPHHLKNYVPSRLPHSGPGDSNQNSAAHNIWPLPIRFLTAQIPPRSGKKSVAARNDMTTNKNAVAPPTAPENDEWICAFCEYNIFYGGDAALQKAIRNRKKILKRRRNARERAAAAARGANLPKSAPPPPPPTDDEYDDYDGAGSDRDEYGTAPTQRTTKSKTGPDKSAPEAG